jgi:hypothetical protein
MRRPTNFPLLSVFIATGTCLPSRYLAVVREIHIDTQTDERDL